MASHPWGINWQSYHPAGRIDFEHIERMGYRSFVLYEWMWNNAQFCQDLLAAAPADAVFLLRDHPLSEQKEWLTTTPQREGIRFADEWSAKFDGGRIHLPRERCYCLGPNEVDTEHFRQQLDIFTVYFATQARKWDINILGWEMGVGHPATFDLTPNTLPYWKVFEASAQALIENGHAAGMHEYGIRGSHGWGYHCGRLVHCPYEIDVYITECGIAKWLEDQVADHGWRAYQDMRIGEYLQWLDEYQFKMRTMPMQPRVKTLNIFSYDGNHDWWSFRIDEYREELEHFVWRIPAQEEHVTHIPTVNFPPAEGQSVPFRSLFQEMAKKYNVPWTLLAATAKVESNFDPDAVGASGEKGMMQFMPATWADEMKRLGMDRPHTDAHIPALAVEAAASHMRWLRIHLRHSSWDWVSAAYNCGLGRVEKVNYFWNHLPESTQYYARKVLATGVDYARNG